MKEAHRWVVALALTGAFMASAAPAKPFRLDPAKRMTQYVINSWRDTSGLPVDSIGPLAQTPDGYLWLGTEHGLVRFDGVRFTVFDRDNTPALRTNEILSLFLSSSGTLWIGTRGGGAATYDGTRFSRVPSPVRWPMAFAESRDGTMWIGGPAALARLGRGSKTILRKEQGYEPGRLSGLVADGDGVYAALGPEVVRFDDHGAKKWTVKEGLSGTAVTALAWTSHGLLAGNEAGGVDRLVGERFESVFRVPSGYAITSIIEGASGSLWMSTIGGGVLRYANGNVEHLTELEGLTSDSVAQLFEDAEGSIWAATVGGGLVSLSEGKVSTIVPPQNLAAAWIHALVQGKDGSMWFSSNSGGVNRLSGDSLRRFTTFHDRHSNYVSALAVDRDGSIWIGAEGTLQRVVGDRVVQTFNERDGIVAARVLSIMPARDGSVWVGTTAGLHHIVNGVARKLTEKDGITPGAIFCIREAGDGSLWLSRSGSIEHYAKGKVQVFGKEQGLRSHGVTSSTLDERDGSLWSGTIGGGIARIRNGRVRMYRVADGLLTDSVYGVVLDQDGNLWMPTSRGLFAIKRNALDEFDAGTIKRIPITVFRKSDGLKSTDFTGGLDLAGIRAADGKMWFPTTRGIVVVDPEKLRARVTAPRVIIESISANGVNQSRTPRVDVTGNRQIEIAYTAPTFDSPEAMRFRYRLEGFDKAWQDAGARRTAFYTNVPPGQYRFVVQATTADGRSAETSTTMEIVPHFYETARFKLAIALMVILVILVLHRRRVDSIRQRQAELRKSEEHFRWLIENASDMILVIDPDETVSYASPSVERALGVDPAAITGKPLVALLADAAAGASFLAQVRTGGQHAATLHFRDSAGTGREVESIGAISAQNGRIVLNCRDVVDRRKLESQLEQANRLASLGRLAMTVSHEFNNVLMGIQPFIDLIRRKVSDPTVQHATQQVTRSVHRGKRISEEILRFTRPVEPTLRPIAARSWLADLETELRSLMGSGTTMSVHIPENLALIGDVAQLNQVLTNLAINARDAGASEVRIEASAVEGDGVYPFGILRDPHRMAHIRFTDNGGGINETILPKIFEPLFTTKTNKGTGLGLAVAQQVVARHGGELFAESQVGVGTTFHLFLRLASMRASEIVEEAATVSHVRRCRVLLVEDDAAVGEGITAVMQYKGFEIRLAITGAEALNVIPRFLPEVVVLDVGLPDIDGIELYRQIIQRWPRQRVIFSTGHGDIASLQETLPPPHPVCLRKPYTIEALIAAIASAGSRDRSVA